MMNKDDGFQREKWNKGSSQTEVSDITLEGQLPETQIPIEVSETETKRPRLMMWLIVSNPPEHRGTVLPIAEGTLIGRHGDIPWQDPRMSRKHAKFIILNDANNLEHEIFALEPQNDRNGTMVNGGKISETTPLRENDVIIMGDTRIVVKVLE
jgi:hypothetical protein